MRILLSPRFWMSIGVMCLSVTFAPGCRGTGMGAGPGWFSWMNPKPASSALATTPPTKPSSVAMLPNPGATTGSTTPGTGTGAATSSYTGATNHQHGAANHTSPGNYYNTGPYAMSGQSTAGLSATAGGTQAAGSYGANAAATTAAPGYSGYQSPYANPANPAARMADSRSSYPVANPYSAPQSVTPAANTSTEQWNRGGAYGSGSAPAAFNEQAANRSVAPSQPESMGSAGSWTPPANNSASSNNYLDRFPTSPEANNQSAAQAPRRENAPYRPGSTNRNGGSLPATLNTTNPPAANPAASAPSYPATSYPTSGYSGGAYPTSGSNPPSGAYPTTGGYPTSSYPSMDPSARTATTPNTTGAIPASNTYVR